MSDVAKIVLALVVAYLGWCGLVFSSNERDSRHWTPGTILMAGAMISLAILLSGAKS